MTATGTSGNTPEPELGIGQIVSDVMVVFFRRLPKVLLLSLPGGITIGGIFYVAFVWESGLNEYLFDSAEAFFTAGVIAVATALGSGLGLASGPLTTGYHSYQLRGHLPFWPSLRRALARPFAAVFCGVMVTVATMVPFTVIILVGAGGGGLIVTLIAIAVGMYAMGRWGTALPAVSMDRLGISALGRANRLSAGYRWRIAATCFVLWISALLLGGLAAAGLALGVAAFDEFVMDLDFGFRMEELLVFLDAVLGLTVSAAFLALGLAAIRERMVEIKEPPDIADMVDVFD